MKKGQSLTEYGIGIGLLTVVSITALTGMGMNLNNIFSGMITQAPAAPSPAPSTPPPATPSPATSPTNQIPAWVPTALAKLPPASPGTQPACFDGLCVNLPIVDSSNNIVDTTGGNGAERIHQFANVLTQIAEQLKQEPNSDPAITQLISDMAIKGHGIGDQNEIVAKQCTPLANKPGFTCNSAVMITINEKGNAFSNVTNDFWNYYIKHPNSLGSTSLSVIQQNLYSIKNLNALQNFTLTGGGPQGSFVEKSTNNVYLAHQSANNICDQGGKNCYVPPKTP